MYKLKTLEIILKILLTIILICFIFLNISYVFVLITENDVKILLYMGAVMGIINGACFKIFLD